MKRRHAVGRGVRGLYRLWLGLSCWVLGGLGLLRGEKPPVWLQGDEDLGPPGQAVTWSGPAYIGRGFVTQRDLVLAALGWGVVAPAQTLHWAGVVASGPSGDGLAKLGAGGLALSEGNGYRGNTRLMEGTLVVENDTALGDSLRTLEQWAGTTLRLAPGLRLPYAVQLHLVPPAPGQGLPAGLPPIAPPAQGADVATWEVPEGEAVAKGGVLGAVPLVKRGEGRLRMRGNSSAFDGEWRVVAGALAVDGFFAGHVQVGREARLEGVGVVGSVAVAAGGWLSPGWDGQGSLAVQGALVMARASVLQVTASPDGWSTSLRVEGSATLAGRVQVRAQPGAWMPRTRLRILRAAAGLGDSYFDGVVVDLPHLRSFLEYELQPDGVQAVVLVLALRDEEPASGLPYNSPRI